MTKKILAAIIVLTILICSVPAISAETADAVDITKDTTFSGTGYSSFAFLSDGDIKGYKASSGNTEITIKSSKAFSSLYLMFDLEYGEYTITDNISGKTFAAGANGFLHELVTLETATTSVTLKFENGQVRLSELYVFTDGTLPDFVQKWDVPLEGKADIVLFATHGDDDQLFFAGLLPHYAAEVKCGVQVVYLTNHRNLTKARTHEMLNGLWNVGVTAYPVFGAFADFRIDDLEGTYSYYEDLGTTREELQSFVVEQIRRFKPQVAIGHDLEGEYGHGMHMVYADLLVKALDITQDASQFPESAQKYGTWEIPKTYLHLYAENPIELDYDTPLEAFNGMTAFEVTQKLGYPCHDSQQYTWFTKWINWVNMSVGGTPITKATQIRDYNPCKFGLYRSTVGEDVLKNDFLENIVTYAEQERLEQERLEQERLEQERLEQERLEQERLEQERLEQERLEHEQKEARELGITIAVLVFLVAALICVLIILHAQKVRRRRRGTARRRSKNIA